MAVMEIFRLTKFIYRQYNKYDVKFVFKAFVLYCPWIHVSYLILSFKRIKEISMITSKQVRVIHSCISERGDVKFVETILYNTWKNAKYFK